MLKIASAEVLHLIKPGGPEKHLHILPALQLASRSTIPTAHAQAITVRIVRLLGRPGAPGGQWVRRWSREASASLWISGTEPEQEARRLNSAANLEERREKRNPGNGAGRGGRRKRGTGRDPPWVSEFLDGTRPGEVGQAP